MSKVYIVQERMVRDPGTGMRTPQLDFTPAAKYGQLEVLLPPGPIALNPGPMIHELRNRLQHYSDEDYLLCAGDPTAIAAAAIMAAKANRGVVNLLKWDKRADCYVTVRLET